MSTQKTVLNITNPINKTNKLFLGEQLGIVNLSDPKYPIFKSLFKEQQSFTWFPDEISMLKDASDIKMLSTAERFIFESNLAYQTLGDSFIGKGIGGIIEYVTNNELFLSLKTHEYFEAAVHTPSYSHIFESIYNEPASKFYEILNTKEIVSRAEQSTKNFNELLNNNDPDVRKDIINCVISVFVLESISFYNSFITSYFFAKNGKMSGTGSIITLINRDEALHRSNMINILKILMKESSEGFFDLKEEIQARIVESIRMMANQEFDWIDYLMSKGELVGLTANGLKTYIKHLSNSSMGSVGLKTKLFEAVKNPFPWVNSFQSSSKSTQIAPQEQQLTAYVKSSKNDLDSMNYDF